MPLVRTEKGLQWISDSDASIFRSSRDRAQTSTTAIVPPPMNLSSLLKSLVSKDVLPWIMAGFQVVSWFGVKYLTSDRMAQQASDDHIAITDMRKAQGLSDSRLSGVEAQIKGLDGKVDLLINLNLKGK